MKRLFIKSLAISVAMIGAAALSAEACQMGVYSTAPSNESRWVEHDGYRFQIPSNYRAELTERDTVELYDPDAAQYLDCLRRSPYGSDLPNSVTVQTIDARVSSAEWPYNIPFFEWFQDPGGFNYSSFQGQEIASFVYFGGYEDTWIANFVQNLSGGGAAYVHAPIYDEESASVYDLVWVTLEEM